MPRVGGDVDDIAQQILTGRHHVADIDADTEFDALVVRHLGVSLSRCPQVPRLPTTAKMATLMPRASAHLGNVGLERPRVWGSHDEA